MKRGRNQRRRQGMNINRALDSNGPDVRIRGTANQIYDKYLALARDASSSGDRVKAENYLQHAEHYFRLIRSLQPPQQQQSQNDAVDADGEQPSITDNGEKTRRRENNNNDGAVSAETASEDTSDDEKAPEAKANGADPEENEQRRPKRRRPRRPVKGEDAASADTDEEKTEAAAS